MQARQFIFNRLFVTSTVIIFLLSSRAPVAAAPNPQSNVQGPFTLTSVKVASFDGDVRRLPAPRTSAPNVEREAPRPRRQNNTPPSSTLTTPRAPANPSTAAPLTPRAPSANQNFDGLDISVSGGWVPPDPNGDVGPNHYIQAVNIALGIYTKTGTQLAAFSFSTLFASGVSPCNTSNFGDPIVVYDAISGRWIAEDFAWANSNGPFYECIAVSKTTDPVSGDWWLYTVNVSQTTAPGIYWFNDYPKLASGADGIYMSANMFRDAVVALSKPRACSCSTATI